MCKCLQQNQLKFCSQLTGIQILLTCVHCLRNNLKLKTCSDELLIFLQSFNVHSSTTATCCCYCSYITMAFPLGNFAALRTMRVLRALKTVAVVPGRFVSTSHFIYLMTTFIHDSTDDYNSLSFKE